MELKKQLITYLNNLFTLGAKEGANKNDLKKIKLFNAACIQWYLIALLLVFLETPPHKAFFNIANITHLVFIALVAIIQFIHYKKYYLFAYFCFILLMFSLIFLFCNYLIKGELLEYYYMLVIAASLIFIDKKVLNYIVLFICFLAFYLPNKLYNYYPSENFSNLSQPFLLILVFITINYFKNLNIKNEKSLELKTKELEELNNFKSQFFTNVSHEIRTPITLIKGYNDELTDALNTTEKTQKIQQNINIQVQKIAEMVNGVLDLAKMEETKIALNLVPTNMVTLLNKVYISFESLFHQKNIHLELKTKNRKCIALVDVLFIERALNNILTNALKYTEKGSVTMSIYCSKNKSIIKIKDTGIGIPPKDLDKVFNRFYQANNHINKAGGSGVGLAFTHEILKLHHGAITVKSNLGVGSEFTIELPAYKKKDNEIEKTIDLTTKTPKNDEFITAVNLPNITFLIVDDTIEMRTYLKTILQNYKCLEADNGIDALKMVKQNTVHFIITDYMMPKMNGYDFIKQLKTDGYGIPIIMLTAKTDISLKIDALELGIDDYLTKPFEKKELLIRIKNAINNHSERDHTIKTLPSMAIIPSEDFIKELENFIVANLGNKELSQDDIITHFSISKSSLYRKLKSKTGLSPNEFVTEVKLQKARTILENNPTILLKQLAQEVGFTNVYYFTTLYEKRFGSKPTSKN